MIFPMSYFLLRLEIVFHFHVENVQFRDLHSFKCGLVAS
jgi:hypothetical protein